MWKAIRDNNPLFWHRYGFPHVNGWKMRGDSPKAHALIRHYVYVYQLATARAISDGLYQNNHENMLSLSLIAYVN